MQEARKLHFDSARKRRWSSGQTVRLAGLNRLDATTHNSASLHDYLYCQAGMKTES